MPRLITLVFGSVVVILCNSLFAANTQPTIQSLDKMPLAFTQNNGQWDSHVLFRADAGGATMWFTKEGVTYQFTRRIDRDTNAFSSHSRESGNPGSVGRTFLSDPGQAGMPILPSDGYEKDSVEQLVLTAKFVGANPNPEVVAEGQMEYKCNYFLGNDPSKWHTDVPNYEAITLKDIYPGIDLKYYGNGDGKMEYDFIVQPGANPKQIAIRYDGAAEVCVDDAGQLVVETEWGRVTERAPLVWQVVEGDRREITAHYVLKEGNTFGFKLDEGYDREYAVVVDPVLSYSTYLGASGGDFATGIAVGLSNCAYVSGYTYSSDFPVLNPYQTDQGNSDVFVTKLDSMGNSLIYSTYLGGSDQDDCRHNAIAVDTFGCVYLVGRTFSIDFPIVSAYDSSYNGWVDVFITKLTGSGSGLVYSTYVGTSYEDQPGGIAVDVNGKVYVTGFTNSADFPTLNPLQNALHGPYDAFVLEFNSVGVLEYSTYLGGALTDYGVDIDVDDVGNCYVIGETCSFDFPTSNAIDSSFNGSQDIFVAKLNATGSSFIYSTYLGGSGAEYGGGIALDRDGHAYLVGTTQSADFPLSNPYQSVKLGYNDVFVSKISADGTDLAYSTYIGGSSDEDGDGIAVDTNCSAYITGYTNSTDFPTINAFQSGFQGGYTEVFVVKMKRVGNGVVYSSYLGGSGDDGGYMRPTLISVDRNDNAYITGTTGSVDFPTIAPFQSYQGGGDVFVTKFGPLPPDASVLRIIAPDSTVNYLSTLNPQALVCNEGENPETIPVIFQIGSTYTDNSEVTLFPGDTSVMTFANWNADTVGSFNITCFTTLETDNYRGNDTLKSVVTVVADTMAPVIQSVTPSRGGNTGSVTVTVAGDRFQSGARTKLTRAGETEITADSAMTLVLDSTTIIATFDLRDRTVGLRDVVVTNPNSTSTIFHDVFRIEAGNEAVWCDVIGPSSFRPGRTETVWVGFGNSGNVDVNDYLLRITIPASALCQLDSADFLLPVGSQVSWDSIPAGGVAGTELIIPVWLVRMVPGFADVINLKITVPGGYPGQVFPLLAEIGTMMPSSEFSVTGNLAVLEAATGFNHLVDATIDSWPTLPIPGRVDIVAAYLAEFEQLIGGLRSTFDQRGVGGLDNVNQEPNIRRAFWEHGATTTVTAIAATVGAGEGVGLIFQLSTGVAAGFEGVMMINQHYKRYEPWLAMARDPNDKIGPIGFDTSYAYVSPDQTFNYVIYFENDSAATADAENIMIIDTLDANLDWSTLRFGQVFPGAGPDSIRPSYNAVTNFDPTTGELSWSLSNINLPPDSMPYWGEGWVSYSVKPRANLASGTQIENIAAIKFNVNDWILAPMDSIPIVNTIDASTPSSSVATLPDTTRGKQFNVKWSGSDEVNGSGIGSYSIYVSIDNGFYELWATDSLADSAQYTGSIGHSYAFYSIATDNVGHVEAKPASYDARTSVSYLCGDANADKAVDISDVVYLIAFIFSGGSAPNPLLAGDANCDSTADISDVVYLIAYIFSGGAAPCKVCE